MTEAYLESVKLQNRLFALLSEAIEEAISGLGGRFPNGVDLRPNVQWRNWGFRGLRMKPKMPDGSVPDGPSPYRWRIYYDAPSVIALERYDEKQAGGLGRLDLCEGDFFALDEAGQCEVLRRFVVRALSYA